MLNLLLKKIARINAHFVCFLITSRYSYDRKHILIIYGEGHRSGGDRGEGKERTLAPAATVEMEDMKDDYVEDDTREEKDYDGIKEEDVKDDDVMRMKEEQTKDEDVDVKEEEDDISRENENKKIRKT